MNYRETLHFLYSSLPIYQRDGKAAYKANLDTTIKLDNLLGNPHNSFKSVHIAGTNGKGSVSHMLASVLSEAGNKTGLYTSPHIRDFRERIKVNGVSVTEEYVVDFVGRNLGIIQELKPSFFEMTVALAFQYFSDSKVDIAVIETGMGGRLDSTNIISPLVSVITNIGLDHTQFLGETIEKIAIEKGGIIKPGIPVVIGETKNKTKPLFERIAKEKGSDIMFADSHFSVVNVKKHPDPGKMFVEVKKDRNIFINELEVDLAGNYQLSNLQTLMGIIEEIGNYFQIDENIIRKGLGCIISNTGLEGRWQVLMKEPLVICDTAHNFDGLKIVMEQLRRAGGKRLHIVLGFVDDKDITSLLTLFPREADYYFTRAHIPRSLDQNILAERANGSGLVGKAYISVKEAFRSALEMAGNEDTIFVGGSTFIVSDLLTDSFEE